MLTSEKPHPPGADSSFLRPFRPAQVSSVAGLGRKKASALALAFRCAERPRFELGDQKSVTASRLLHYHSATSPKIPLDRCSFASFGEGKNSEILSCTATHAKGVCILAVQMSTRTFSRIQKLNNTMKKLLSSVPSRCSHLPRLHNPLKLLPTKRPRLSKLVPRMPKRLRAPKVTKPPATSPSLRDVALRAHLLPRTPRALLAASLHLPDVAASQAALLPRLTTRKRRSPRRKVVTRPLV